MLSSDGKSLIFLIISLLFLVTWWWGKGLGQQDQLLMTAEGESTERQNLRDTSLLLTLRRTQDRDGESNASLTVQNKGQV